MPHPTRSPRNSSRASPYTPPLDNGLHSISPYAPIDSENGGIRLLELAPGRFDDAIVMNLIPSNLSDDSRTYEALSYVWGTDIAPRSARLNGIQTSITLNLDCALRHIRGTIVKRILWIDAISMNQKDTQERSHQVQIMGKIYSSAQGVIVWLGPVATNDLHLRAVLGAMQFQFASGNSFTATLFDYMCSVITLIHEQSGETIDAENLVLDAVHYIISRPWFSRLWVVQELALAQRATIRIGAFNLPWEPFESFMKWLPDHKADFQSRPKLVYAAQKVAKMACSRPFSDQFLRTFHLSATDPRDKIFGILGISTFNGTAIEPDYTRSMQQIVNEAACLIIKEKRLVMYYCMPLQPRTEAERSRLNRSPDLPSWVPDPRIEGASWQERRTAHTIGSSVSYHGEADHRPITMLRPLIGMAIRCEEWFHIMLRLVPICPAHVSEDGRRLVAPGVLLGIIAETFPNHAGQEDNESPLALPQNVYRIYDRLAEMRLDVVNIVRVLMQPRTSVGYHRSERHRRRAATRLLDPFDAGVDEPEEVVQAMQEIVRQVKDNISNRISFLTTDNVLGITHHPDLDNGIRPGDVIVGLFGINFPFILRPVDDSSYSMINVTGLATHSWGHSFFNNSEEYSNRDMFSPPEHFHKVGATWKDYAEHGMEEYVIV